jgi:hypothetical protein
MRENGTERQREREEREEDGKLQLSTRRESRGRSHTEPTTGPWGKMRLVLPARAMRNA